ncbi:alpha-1,6-mannosyl-glycoprotein 2-beta-N-acetylglucosaminyltransferase-like [Diadema setosum]|uniref:alpha-1,6-mannosyl-glycoprotein 2-beta-N-acetylglucosaminyltransferase-like n=1 Tax=Diadema setosum TaxID=31175 RepID=UPI003B3BC421
MRPRRTIKTLCVSVGFVILLWMVLPALKWESDDSIEANILKVAKRPLADVKSNIVNGQPKKDKSLVGQEKLIHQQKRQVADSPEMAIEEAGPPDVIATKRPNISLGLSAQSERVKEAMLTINHEQKIWNKERYPVRPEDSIVIVVMVHDRLEYLEYLIESLRKADGISSALLIFSHDYYSEDINRVVRRVDFCQMMQIFYPYSLQVYQNEFPGMDPKDCPRDITREKARQTRCNNWEHPDSYGHYREVRYVMTKHHWFWKLQHIFSGLEATRNHEGLVVFMEEDHYVAPDFYPMLQKMYTLKKEKCPECDILTLGNYDKTFVYRDRIDKVDILTWQSSKHNMGMSLDRRTWEKLQPCVQVFCTYDDYNWDWTMNYVSHKCLKSPMKVMVFKSPRIFHIGECGIHHKGKCSADDLIHRINRAIAADSNSFFPKELVLTPSTRPLKAQLPKPNGGWGDVRDHALCMTYGKSPKNL